MARLPKDFIGAVLYRGPSEFDGSPIVLVASGFSGAKNSKTGAGLIQTYIIREDMTPREASLSGADASICGRCPHQGEHDVDGNLIPATRSCYVNLAHGPRMTHDALTRGRYVDMTQANPKEIARLFRGRKVRMGAYGDPAAVPYHVWEAVLSDVDGITGYTHAWREYPHFNQWVMASCDNSDERVEAKFLGFRTFRVAPVTDWVKEEREVLCPASKEAGYKTTCDTCLACGGLSSKARADIVIPLHSSGTNAAMRRGIVA